MIRGTTKNIGINPLVYKDLDKEETYLPYHIELRNGFITDAGYWKKRNGFADWRSIGVNQSVNLLIPAGSGYATLQDGKIFNLESTPEELTGARLTGDYRPTWTNFKGVPIVCNGDYPVKIMSHAALLDGSPAKARFIDVISNYCILAGINGDPTKFQWSASGNAENWTTGDSGFANTKMDGDIIRYFKVHKEKAFFFKDHNIEVWYNRGGTTPFARLNELWIEKGLGADYSVVLANDTFHWFGDDGDFYVLNGIQPQVISKGFRSYFDDKLKNYKDLYGFDCRKENCIRWFSPVDGICIKYDYLKNHMSEDNTWQHGQWERLPWNSYMELNNEQYFGDYDPTGKIYHWSKDYKDDNGEPIRVARNFKLKLSDNGNKASVNKLMFSMKRGVATTTITDPLMLFRDRFDNGDWNSYENVDMGILGDYDPYQEFFRRGIGRDYEIEIIETDTVEFLLKDILLTVIPLGR